MHRRRAVEFVIFWLRRRFHPSHLVANICSKYLEVYKRLGFSIDERNGERYRMTLDDRPFLDATVPLREGVEPYPGDPPFSRTLVCEEEDGGYNVSVVTMSVHTGTHIDAPAHVGLLGGAETIDLAVLFGSAQLIDWPCPNLDAIRAGRVLLARAQRGLTRKETEIFVNAGISLVGIDRLSIGIEEEEWIVHQILLQNGVVILENADLARFPPGWYEMRCLPLSMPGSDGVPVRLLLREERS